MTALVPAAARALAAALAQRQAEVSEVLRTTVPSPSPALASAGGVAADPEEALRVLMVRLWPRFVRRHVDAAAVREALGLLTSLREAAEASDLRFFDAFNNFWEHWPIGQDTASDRAFAEAYAPLIAHHLGCVRT